MTNLVQMFVDPRLTTRWLHAKDLGSADFGYGVHSLLRAAFGEHGPQPFRVLHRDSGVEVLGYSAATADTLKRSLAEVAEPMAAACIDQEMLFSKPLPMDWKAGATFAFDIRVCPVSRSTQGEGEDAKCREKDYFLARLDQVKRETGSDPELSRYTEYQGWLETQIGPAARVLSANVTAFTFQTLHRRNKERDLRVIRRPDVTISGRLAVADPAAFSELLAKGVGRHRAFGFGMLLLRPDRTA